MQDLRLINEAVVPLHPVVPNPYTLLSHVPPKTSHFTVLDLKDAFFTIPLHPDSYFLFAFTWEDPDTHISEQLTWTVLPQGFRDSPHIFGQALAADLQQCTLKASTLLQYVDDLLLCSPSLVLSQEDTSTLLNFLEKRGYRVTPSKAQLCTSTVVYLGILLTPTTKALTEDRIRLLRDLQPPQTADEILSFLGLVGFFRHWIPNFAILARPLYQAAKETPQGPLTDPTSIRHAFSKLRDCLTAGPVLALPDPSKPFHLFTDERSGSATGLLAQPVGPTYRATAYLSKQLDATTRGWQPCLRALAAAASLTKEALKLTLGQPLIVYSPHRLMDLLSHRSLAQLTPSRLQLYHLLFIENPQISLSTSPRLNPATLLPAPSSTPEPTHSCPQLLEDFTPSHPGLSDQPLSNPDRVLFVDGSSLLASDGHRRAAYAVVTTEAVVETAPLPIGTTSQKAELIALTRALHLSKGQRVTIYTDSRYAYLITHTHSILWQERGFLTTKGTPIVNGPLIAKLLEALSLPTEVAVVHCRGHQVPKDQISQGNNKADSVARQTALNTSLAPILFLNTPHLPSYTQGEIQTLQGLGGKPGDKGWIYIQDKIALPENLAHTLITDIHQSLHIGPKALYQFLQPLFHHPSLFKVIETVHKACATCSAVNAQGGIRRPGPNHQLRGHQPGEDWQLDFTHMPRHKTFRYLLTLVDTFTGWIEAYPTARETADVVAATLIEHIIPRFGLPRTLQSDNGPAFISSVTQQVAESLNITWKLHIPYHPQSSGKVEKANGLLKAQLTKLTLETRLSWPTLLPLALTRLRATPRGPSGLSPFELLYGRPFLINHNLPASPPPLLSYLPYLTLLRTLLRAHADAVIPAPNGHSHGQQEAPPQGLFPGDQVLLKNRHPDSLQTRWSGPYTVILTTPTAAKLLGHQAWVHISNLKRAPPGGEWTSQTMGPTKLRLVRAPSLNSPDPPGSGGRM